METTVADHNGIRVLQLSGHVGASDLDALIAELGKLKETPGGKAVLDMALLKNLPTAAIGALIELIRSLENVGGRMVLAAPDPRVRVTLDRLGVSPMVAITESLDEALAELAAGASGL